VHASLPPEGRTAGRRSLARRPASALPDSERSVSRTARRSAEVPDVSVVELRAIRVMRAGRISRRKNDRLPQQRRASTLGKGIVTFVACWSASHDGSAASIGRRSLLGDELPSIPEAPRRRRSARATTSARPTLCPNLVIRDQRSSELPSSDPSGTSRVQLHEAEAGKTSLLAGRTGTVDVLTLYRTEQS
jgi:hypothetical protein